jgi:hypothetical protein
VDKEQRVITIEHGYHDSYKIKDGDKEVTRWKIVKSELFVDLDDGKAMTAAGKVLDKDEVLKRIAVGKVVVLMDPDLPEKNKEVADKFRATLKDDAIILIGRTKEKVSTGVPK